MISQDGALGREMISSRVCWMSGASGFRARRIISEAPAEALMGGQALALEVYQHDA